jgi:hypothetical protein
LWNSSFVAGKKIPSPAVSKKSLFSYSFCVTHFWAAAAVFQGCQMVYFQTKIPLWEKIFRALDWKMLIYFIAIWNILETVDIFYDHSVHFVFIGYICSGFGIMHQVKSGSPAVFREKAGSAKNGVLNLTVR